MKINFIVSVFNKIWIKESKRLFLAEPYVYHYLTKNDALKNYSEVQVAPHIRSTKEELIHDHNFVDEKYHKYIPILAERLNRVHGTDYSSFFWQKSLSLSLIRNITFLYDMFQRCERHLDVSAHDCRILSEGSYYTPVDFNDHRNFFQSTAFGQEQMFSIYIKEFHPNRFESINHSFSWPLVPTSKQGNKLSFYLRRFSRITFSKILLRIIEMIKKISASKIAIIESYFSSRNLVDLIIKTAGRIQQLQIKSDFKFSASLNVPHRIILSSPNADFDKFDRFFFSSLKYCFPQIFIEHFNTVYNYYQEDFERYKKLKYVVNESWIGNNYAAIAVGILQQKNIKHICNEHNYLSHHFLCNNNKYLFPLVDKYVSLGWFKNGIPNLIQGGSLFEWVLAKNYVKQHEILFINGPPAVKVPEISAAYGHFGSYNAYLATQFNHTFFDLLKPETLASMVFRGYPVDGFAISYLQPQMMMYDQHYLFRKYLPQFKMVDCKSGSAKLLIQKSRLVIIDYLSTSYLESLLANIPTIFFWNKAAYPLEAAYSDFYDILIEVGICQTDPVEAASFVEKIKSNPERWWSQDDVQSARKKFVSENFGDKDVLKNYLIKLSAA